MSESEHEVQLNRAFTPTAAFATGTGTVELFFGGTWKTLAASGVVAAGTLFKIRVSHSAPFSATLTLTF